MDWLILSDNLIGYQPQRINSNTREVSRQPTQQGRQTSPRPPKCTTNPSTPRQHQKYSTNSSANTPSASSQPQSHQPTTPSSNPPTSPGSSTLQTKSMDPPKQDSAPTSPAKTHNPKP
ncbi:unnamed protein product [Aspergillus oryzae]|uniref:Unnamed protein product n=1 Tax=Aspergillus oryzae TaxID=5062 RepID=A0AAN5BTJ5_ASPOZ|nr:unnamed protein product [Aspergillus oryzae]GMF91772.1 unnamed protein product [Aspergillus oryzae]GMG04936.1 unnamed protein product [Aspergillus oryzae]GMG32000.1 unnamed protein product [Aspergillus oryzae]